MNTWAFFVETPEVATSCGLACLSGQGLFVSRATTAGSVQTSKSVPAEPELSFVSVAPTVRAKTSFAPQCGPKLPVSAWQDDRKSTNFRARNRADVLLNDDDNVRNPAEAACFPVHQKPEPA